jgi:YVTN family beta-propeller protein
MRARLRVSLLQIFHFVAAGLFLVWPAAAGAQTVVTTIPLGARPGAMAVNPVTNKIYVASCTHSLFRPAGSLTVIDGATNATTVIEQSASPKGVCPTALAVNPVTNKIYGFDPNSASIVIIDGATNSTTMVAESHSSVAIAVNSATNKIYLANASPNSNPSASVTVLDGATNSIATIVDPNTSGLGAVAIAVNSATNKIYVANNSIETGATKPGNITVIDGATNSTTTVTDPNAISPFSVDVNSGTNKVYVANIGEGTNHGNVTVIDGATNSITTVTDPNALLLSWINGREFAVAVNSATNKIYVANADSNNVTVIDGATNATTTVTDPNARDPIALAVDSVTNMIYVANSGTNPGSVTVINGATNTATTIIDPKANGSDAVAVNPTTNKIYVANLLSNNATVIDGGATATSHILSVLRAGNGSGTVTSNPAGIDCTTSCNASFATGAAVILTASSASGSEFSGWSSACTGAGSCNLTLNSDEFVTATFNLLDFSIAPASTTLTAQRGGQTTDVITIAPQNGSFASAIQLSCAVTGSTPLATCSLSSASVTPGANSVTSTLTVTAPTQSAEPIPSGEAQFSRPLYAVLRPMQGLVLLGLCVASSKIKQRRRQLWLACSLFIAFVALQIGCGGGSSTPPPTPLNYTVTVTATSGAIQHTTQVTVTVP